MCFFFKQKTAYEMRISDWSSDGCSSDLGRCQTDTPEPGVADVANSCGTPFDYRFNPSNTGNIRVNSRFTLADGLVLTVDPSYQYVKANGGGTTTGYEYSRDVGGTPLFGRSEEHTSELQSLMRITYAVFCLKKKISHICKQHTF